MPWWTPASRRPAVRIILLVGSLVGMAAPGSIHAVTAEVGKQPPSLHKRLRRVLKAADFTGRVESTLTARLGRPIDPGLADLGRLLFFDKVLGLHDDNSCAGCHAPKFGFGDSGSICIPPPPPFLPPLPPSVRPPIWAFR